MIRWKSFSIPSPAATIVWFVTRLLFFFSHSVMSNSVIPWTAGCQAYLSFIISQSLLKLMSIESVIPSNHLILCHPLFLLFSIYLSIRIFSNESALGIRWPKDWRFSINPFNEYSGLISFRIDWFDLLAIQVTLKSLPQHHNSKASIMWCTAFFMVQFSHPYMTMGKTIGLIILIFIIKVSSAQRHTWTNPQWWYVRKTQSKIVTLLCDWGRDGILTNIPTEDENIPKLLWV